MMTNQSDSLQVQLRLLSEIQQLRKDILKGHPMTDQSNKIGNVPTPPLKITTMEAAKHLIQVAIEASGQTFVGWIDAAERKPAAMKWVLVYRPANAERHYHMAVDLDRWGGPMLGWTFGPVTHWAPLPDPPRVEDGETAH
jgi:hypothetical protein